MSKHLNERFYINQDLVISKISDIEKSMVLMNKLAVYNIDDFLRNEIIISASKYQLVLAIEAAQNICNHLSARVAKEVPTSYADCFRILANNNIISSELSAKLIAMSKFHNLLVHQYKKVDDRVVFNILKKDIQDLTAYVYEIKSYLTKLRDME